MSFWISITAVVVTGAVFVISLAINVTIIITNGNIVDIVNNC